VVIRLFICKNEHGEKTSNVVLPSAHAALSPWEGKNALDAAVLGYNNISALRQQLKPTHRVHGIFEGKDWATNSRFTRSYDNDV